MVYLRAFFVFFLRLYFRPMSDNASNFIFMETEVTTVKVHNLVPNTQYILYATALTVTPNASTDVLESDASESLIAWTDPAFPAFVEVRIIKSSTRGKFSAAVSFLKDITNEIIFEKF